MHRGRNLLTIATFSNLTRQKHTRGLTRPRQVEKSVDCSFYCKDFRHKTFFNIYATTSIQWVVIANAG